MDTLRAAKRSAINMICNRLDSVAATLHRQAEDADRRVAQNMERRRAAANAARSANTRPVRNTGSNTPSPHATGSSNGRSYRPVETSSSRLESTEIIARAIGGQKEFITDVAGKYPRWEDSLEGCLGWVVTKEWDKAVPCYIYSGDMAFTLFNRLKNNVEKQKETTDVAILAIACYSQAIMIMKREGLVLPDSSRQKLKANNNTAGKYLVSVGAINPGVVEKTTV